MTTALEDKLWGERETLRKENGALRKQLAEAIERALAAERDRDKARHSAEMACETPADDCSCCGCLLAAERAEAGELLSEGAS